MGFFSKLFGSKTGAVPEAVSPAQEALENRVRLREERQKNPKPIEDFICVPVISAWGSDYNDHIMFLAHRAEFCWRMADDEAVSRTLNVQREYYSQFLEGGTYPPAGTRAGLPQKQEETCC